jgi:hypothetical protein
MAHHKQLRAISDQRLTKTAGSTGDTGMRLKAPKLQFLLPEHVVTYLQT